MNIKNIICSIPVFLIIFPCAWNFLTYPHVQLGLLTPPSCLIPALNYWQYDTVCTNISPSVGVWLAGLCWFTINSERDIWFCWHLVPETEITKFHYQFINTLPAVIISCRTVKLPLCVSSEKPGRPRERDSCHLFVPLTLFAGPPDPEASSYCRNVSPSACDRTEASYVTGSYETRRYRFVKWYEVF
jgi:hypothetical protein